MMDTDPQGSEMEQPTINFKPDRKVLLSVVDRHLCAKFPPKILKCTQKRHNYSVSDFKVVPNYLCCDRPNILRTLFISPQVIFLHILLSLHSNSLLHSRFQCRHAMRCVTTLKTAVQQTSIASVSVRFRSRERGTRVKLTARQMARVKERGGGGELQRTRV